MLHHRILDSCRAGLFGWLHSFCCHLTFHIVDGVMVYMTIAPLMPHQWHSDCHCHSSLHMGLSLGQPPGRGLGARSKDAHSDRITNCTSSCPGALPAGLSVLGLVGKLALPHLTATGRNVFSFTFTNPTGKNIDIFLSLYIFP